ncbi:MAG: sigma-70 family RNA polymerase sigma factor [Phycisphaera sp.]|nr:sigma-70 family RNA polymerase sigma factor [Phycisphaera sp.]
MPMRDPQELEAFVQRLTDHQSRIWALILTLVSKADLAQEVFQETNLVLWRKAAEYDASRPFWPWAKAIARTQVLAAWERMSRDRLVFDPAVMERIVDRCANDQEEGRTDGRQLALVDCLAKLPADQRELLDARYGRQVTVKRLADEQGRSVSGLAVTLHRIRRALADCIDHKLAAEANA